MSHLFSRNYLVLFVLSLLMTSCDSSADISGELKGGNHGNFRVYLIKPGELRNLGTSFLGEVIDSAEVKGDGSFRFKNLPDAGEPILLELAVQKNGRAAGFLENDDQLNANYMPLVYEPGNVLKVSAEAEAFQSSFRMEAPSEVNRALFELRDLKLKAFRKYLADKDWQVEKGTGLLDKEHAIANYREELTNFSEQTEHFLPAMVALRWVSPENDYERVPEFLVSQCDKWKKKKPNDAWTQELCEMSTPSNLPVLIGDVFPDVELPTLDRDTVFLKEQLGKKMSIIDLWASWCAPCRKENREVLVPLWEQYHDRGLQIIAYGLETNEAAWRAAAKRDGANKWLQASDLQGDDAAFLKRIRIRTIPANFILDEKGVVIAKNVHGEALEKLIEEQLESK